MRWNGFLGRIRLGKAALDKKEKDNAYNEATTASFQTHFPVNYSSILLKFDAL